MMPRAISSLGLVCLAACGGGGGGLTAPRAAGAANPASARACGRWVVGAQAAIAQQAVLVLDGGQGTVEAPQFLGELVCQLGQHRPVIFALGWPRSSGSTANLFIAGSKAAEAKLRSDALWSYEPSASMDTQAMWDLMVRLRTWHAAGLDVKLVPFAANPVDENADYQPDESSERYTQLELLSGLARKSPDAAIVLWLAPQEGGRSVKGGPDQSLASNLDEAGVKLLSFTLEAASPSPAAASAGTGAAAASTGTTASWSLERRPGVTGYDGVFRIGPTTPSGDLLGDDDKDDADDDKD